ncbi:MAG: oxygen-independent coproporphyrinogen III oxidase [Cyclobacteriaceae bacterium]
MSQNTLIQKYNTPGPRYTSYPTVPFWDTQAFTPELWAQSVQKSIEESDDGISIYIHLPYCESLCTFCGCNKRITKNHAVEAPYIDALIKEWRQYLSHFEQKPRIQEIHLGGGTPTFFSKEHLSKLIQAISDSAEILPTATLGFEGHPNSTTYEQLETLHTLGFSRVSYGIQCFDEQVQTAINRKQSYAQVKQITEDSRFIGYTSVNYDIIYGLPNQMLCSIKNTVDKVLKLRPDRIAFYSYAHVPWIKGNGQRKFSEADLPTPDQKLGLYRLGKEMLLEAGYVEIGMDHFALPEDALYGSYMSGQLHRNFMGYTENHSTLMIGLGVSAISDSWLGFAQNTKTVEEYFNLINNDQSAVFRGHILTQEDLIIRKHVLDLMCNFRTSFPHLAGAEKEILNRLAEPLKDNLITLTQDEIVITEKGKAFLRNICMAFDMRLWADQPQTQLFSMTV